MIPLSDKNSFTEPSAFLYAGEGCSLRPPPCAAALNMAITSSAAPAHKAPLPLICPPSDPLLQPQQMLQGPARRGSSLCRRLCTAADASQQQAAACNSFRQPPSLAGDHIHPCCHPLSSGEFCCGGSQHAGRRPDHCQQAESSGGKAQVSAFCVYFPLCI